MIDKPQEAAKSKEVFLKVPSAKRLISSLFFLLCFAKSTAVLLTFVPMFGSNTRTVYSTCVEQVTITSPDFIEVDTKKKYALSGEFRTIRNGRKSKFYFGVACYDAKQCLISSTESNRVGTPMVVASVTETSITTTEPFDGNQWKDANTPAYQAIGFHFDGNTLKRPDLVLFKDASGAYSSWEDKTLFLKPDCWGKHSLESVKQRLTSSTVIMNYFAAGTFNYCAVNSLYPPSDWKVYSATMQEEGFNSVNMFRPETKFVKILILANYYPEIQTGPLDELEFSNLTFSKALFDA